MGAQGTGKKWTIRKVAVLGSGVMGSRIACHFANIGCEVLLLDIVPRELNDKEKAAGLTTDSPKFRNRIVDDSLKFAVKSKPAPLYDKGFASRITTGNFDDDLDKIKDCDLVLEAIIENLDIKNSMFAKVDKLRRPGSIVASNTSSIPLKLMTEGRSEDFNKHFVGMHFFNPPRYLKLLEIIPTVHSDKDLLDFLMTYGDLFLGKTMVLCKDTPGFIANRVGVFAMMKTLELVKELGLTPEETDKLSGKATGKPNTGTFRLSDLIGNDTTIKVKSVLAANLPDDENHQLFVDKNVLDAVVEKGWMGDKTKQGFYKKTKERDAKGKSIIKTLDLNTLEYRDRIAPRMASLGAVKAIEGLQDRLKALYAFDDKGGEFVRKSTQAVSAYVSNRIPEIADELYKIDDAIKAGFAWEIGAFEAWEMIGVQKVYDDCVAAGIGVASWVKDMLDAGNTTFYKVENGARLYWDVRTKSYQPIPGTENFIVLDYLKGTEKELWKNAGCGIYDIGDGVLCVEFRTKMNAIGAEVIQGVHKAIDMAEQGGWNGVVIGNNATNFSAGANLAMILMLGVEQEFDEINMAVKQFQNTSMRIRYSSIPVVCAPHGLTLGGGCEFSMHGDHVVAAAETYMGLVEVGVGLIPGGGGTKEMVLRLSDEYAKGDVQLNRLMEAFLTIGQAKVATSGHEALGLGLLKDGYTSVSVNTARQLKDAKTEVLRLASEGYQQAPQREDITVMGKTGLAMVYAGVSSMKAAGYITEYDAVVAEKLGWVMCGGDLDGTQKVSEQYLLDLEREAFVSLMADKRTLERIQHMLKTGKPLRN